MPLNILLKCTHMFSKILMLIITHKKDQLKELKYNKPSESLDTQWSPLILLKLSYQLNQVQFKLSQLPPKLLTLVSQPASQKEPQFKLLLNKPLPQWSKAELLLHNLLHNTLLKCLMFNHNSLHKLLPLKSFLDLESQPEISDFD